MTKPLLIALLLGVSTTAFSQITIESSDMPKARDTFRFVVGNPLGYGDQIALNGENQLWVFNETGSPATTLVEYKNSLSTPYAFFFLNTVGLLYAEEQGLGQVQLEDVYQFYSTSNASYRIEGLGMKISLAPSPLAGNYSVEDKVYQFPLEFGDRDSSTFKLKLQLPLFGNYSQSGFRITEVVGHGQIIVVDDTFDCLKVKSVIVSNDSVHTQFTSFGFPSTRVEYKWLTKDFRIPVAEITGTEVAGNFVPSMARHLAIEPDTATGGGGPGVGIQPMPSEGPFFYPNPSKDLIHLDSRVESVRCFDARGKEVLLEGEGATLQIAHLAPATYFLQLTLSDKSRKTVTMVVVP